MSQGERGILEFKYKFPGQYMFHAHKTEFAEKGWMGSFLVKNTISSGGGPPYSSAPATNNTTVAVYPQEHSFVQKRGDDV
jgi:hypothetical protein